ncbi:MAG: MBL fold metallo-hydrolase [Planctomycetota bacterium]
MKSALLKDDAFLADVESASGDPADVFRVWWLGQSGFLIRWDSHFLFFDPYLSDSLTRKYSTTDKPHVRITEQVVDPARLDFVDVVTSSHNHTDHLDGETLTKLMGAKEDIAVVVPGANRAFAADRLHVPEDRLVSADVGSPIDCGPFRLEAVPAAHEELSTDDQGRHRFIGLVASFGPFVVYHSGDTMLYEGMTETLAGRSIDLSLLPVNGRAPERRVAGNLWGREAAQLAKDISSRFVIPCHYDMFEFNTATPDEFVEACTACGQEFRVLQNGEGWKVNAR